MVGVAKDWHADHEPYDDRTSFLHARLSAVRELICQSLDRAPGRPGPAGRRFQIPERICARSDDERNVTPRIATWRYRMMPVASSTNTDRRTPINGAPTP